jgi:xylulokinase
MSYLGIDLGTSSVKAVVLSENGSLLGEAVETYLTSHPTQGASEQDPDQWWQATARAIRSFDAHTRQRVTGISFSGQMHGTVCLDAEQRLIRPAIIWSDTRGAQIAARLTEEIGRAELARRVGTALAAGFQGVTAVWLREREPMTWSRLHVLMLPKDYLRFRMTGEVGADPSDGAGTGLLDVNTRDWSGEMLEAVGLRREQLPPIKASAEVVGRLTVDAAAEFGLPPGCAVVTGGGDAPLAAVAAGAASGQSLLATLSSGAQAMAFLFKPVVDEEVRVHTFASPLDPAQDECGWYVMGATMVGGMALQWLRGNVFQCGEDQTVDILIKRAGQAPVGSGGLLFAPYLTGERSPHLDPAARAVFLGLTAEHDRRHLTRAVMEGAVFALRDALDIVRSLAPDPADVVLAGGGARSRLWRQIVADIFDLPVRPSRLADQSAVGAAILAASAEMKVPAGTLGAQSAKFDEVVEPIRANVERYAELRELFRDIYTKHSGDFHRLVELA